MAFKKMEAVSRITTNSCFMYHCIWSNMTQIALFLLQKSHPHVLLLCTQPAVLNAVHIFAVYLLASAAKRTRA
jgi:hypothetical protein